MKWTKAPAELVERFGAATPAAPAVEPRKMFGYPCLFVKGHLCAGIFQDRVKAGERPPPKGKAAKGQRPAASPKRAPPPRPSR